MHSTPAGPATGPGPAFLQMNESTSELNQAFIKVAIGAVPVFQPQFLQDFMGFEIKLLIETVEITQVMGV